MNNYRVSVDCTISMHVRSDLNMVDVGGDVVHKVYVAMRSLENADIHVGRVSTNLLDRQPIFATTYTADVGKSTDGITVCQSVEDKRTGPTCGLDDDDDEFLEPEWGIYEDDAT